MLKRRYLPFSLLLTTSLFATQTQMSPIVVTAAKTPQPQQYVTANVDVITAEEIEERGFLTVGDALSTLPGLAVQRNGGIGKSTSVRMRGFDAHRLLVLIDGIRYNDPTLIGGAANFAQLLTDDIARIEVVKGPQSGIWGADASAGVINIITKSAQKEGFSGTVFGEYGAFNTAKGGLDAGWKSGDFDATLNLVHLTSDGFSAIAPDQKRLDDYEDDGYRNTTADLKLRYRLSDRDRISASLHAIDSTSDYDGFDASFQPDPNDRNSSEDVTQLLTRLDYAHTFSKGEMGLYLSRSKFKRRLATGFSKAFDGRVDEVGLNGRWDYRQGDFLNGGIERKRFKHENEIDRSYRNDGFFLSNSNRFAGLIAGETIVTEAVRYDRYDAFSNRFTYKVGLKHIHDNIEGFWTAFNYGTGYNIPTLYQLYSAYGNPDLTPEKTRGYDVTAAYKGVRLTWFDNRIEEMIDFGPDYRYANISGSSKLKGVEFAYSGSYSPLSLAYGLNYTWLNAKDAQDKKLPRRAKHRANFTLDYYGIPKSHIGMQLRYVGKRKKSPYDTDPTVDDKEYTVVDMSADYTLSKALSLYARVDNLLDKTYQDISGYATSPRALYAGFRYRIR